MFEATDLSELPTMTRGMLQHRNSTFVLFSCSKIVRAENRDSVANSGVIAFSAGIVSHPVRDAPSHFHAYLRGLGLLPGSSPSLDKILGGK